MSRGILRWLLLLLPLLAAGCVEEREAKPAAVSKSERSDYVRQAERRLARIDGHIDSLERRVETRVDSTAAELRRELDELELKRQRARHKLSELEAVGAESWESVKQEVGEMLGEMDGDLDRVRGHAGG